jgi:hypothetical protein
MVSRLRSVTVSNRNLLFCTISRIGDGAIQPPGTGVTSLRREAMNGLPARARGFAGSVTPAASQFRDGSGLCTRISGSYAATPVDDDNCPSVTGAAAAGVSPVLASAEIPLY